MKKKIDLSKCSWSLSASIPYLWKFLKTLEVGAIPDSVLTVPVEVPSSVQNALKTNGFLPDWNYGLNAQKCEWVENRHWIFETVLPDELSKDGKSIQLRCDGLDYSGWLVVNGKTVSEFKGTHTQHFFDVTNFIEKSNNKIQIVFDMPPRWLGQFGCTSQMTEWKTRFNYTWDWVPRIVQIGIWDSVYIIETDSIELENIYCVADADLESNKGILNIRGQSPGNRDVYVRAVLYDENNSVVHEEKISSQLFNANGLCWNNLPVKFWWPNLEGAQPLYKVEIKLLDSNQKTHDAITYNVGFRNISWQPCDGAADNSEPWICIVNGKPVFLQGVNFIPVLPNFADITNDMYRELLRTYRDLGINILRINACGFLEKEPFYEICDEYGLMVWQEFPLTSSGIENVPPLDDKSIEAMDLIAHSFVRRRRHHPSLIIWSGGNELFKVVDGIGMPLDDTHPMLHRLKQIVNQEDPTRKFVPASPSGLRFVASSSDFGKGLHGDVHGPWKSDSDFNSWVSYWENDDALFRTEVGCPGTMDSELIYKYAGELSVLPISHENPLWRNPVSWWLEVDAFLKENGRLPNTLEEYVQWSQQRQSKLLLIAVKACKERFPRCGGVILWSGHDCFPCPANCSMIDFEGNPKPVARKLAEVWRNKSKNSAQ